MTSVDQHHSKSSLHEPHVHPRNKAITGAPPRIPALTPSEIGPEGMTIVRTLRNAAGLPEISEIPELVSTFLRHPALYEKHVAIGAALLGHATLAPRLRELAILRTGWLCGAPFEWGEHVAIAKRVGLRETDITRVPQGCAALGWSSEDRAIIAAAEELYGDAMISDATWAALADFLNEQQLIELVYVIGHYTKVAFLQNALRLRLPDGNVGLSAR